MTRTDKPRLAALDPAEVALGVASAALDHVQGLCLSLLSPAWETHCPSAEGATPQPATDDLLRSTQIYMTALDLARYAVYGAPLDAPVHEYLISLIPLYSAALGDGTRDVDGIVESEPDTALGVVIAAALAREQLAAGIDPLTAPQVAVLASLDRDVVLKLAARGDIPGAERVEGKRGQEWRFGPDEPLRQWLWSRLPRPVRPVGGL